MAQIRSKGTDYNFFFFNLSVDSHCNMLFIVIEWYSLDNTWET